MSTNGWGKGSVNNTNGWGAGAINNDIGWGDSQLKSWSGDTDIDGGTGIPVNTVAPVISGTTTLGSVLTTTNGTWTAEPAATFTYQWKRNGSNITGATNSTYTLVNDDGATNITCQVTATNDFGSASAISNTLAIPAFTDADAQAFITAASITNPTQQSAINQLVVDLKGYGVWTKMKALYPFVGGTASSHKYNLKDPRDLDAAFRLVFNGGWTHSATGALPNGTNGYADTFLTPSIHSTLNSQSLGYYSGSNLSETSSDPVNMGAFDSLSQATSLLKSNTFLSSRLNGSLISHSTTTMRGFFSSSKQSSTLTDIYLNGLQVGTGNSGGTLPAQNKCFLGTLSVSAAPYNGGYVRNDFRFAYLSDGLNDTEMSNFYTLVQNFNTTLNRQV